MNLVMPVVVLFYRANDMSMQDIFTLKAIYSFTLMFFEIPTGYFADLVGRRISILVGSVLGTTGYLIYSFSNGFTEFVVAEVALGISLSLVSGADSAMLFDTLKSQGKVEQYTRIEGKITSVGNFAEAIAGILGGLLAVVAIRTPFYFQTVIASFAIPAALLLREPPVVPHRIKTSAGEVLRIIRMSIYSNRKLSWAIILSAIIGANTLTMAWLTQPFFIAAGLETAWFGIAWAVLNSGVGMAAFFAWRIEMRMGSRLTVVLIVAILSVSYLGMSLLPILAGYIVMMIYYLFRGLATPTLRNYINLLTDSEVRATVLSVRNFIIRLMFAVLGPAIGFITDAYSLQTAFLISGLVFGMMGAVSVYFFLKHESYVKQQE